MRLVQAVITILVIITLRSLPCLVKTETSPSLGAKLGTGVKPVTGATLTRCRGPGAVVLITLVMLHTDNITASPPPPPPLTQVWRGDKEMKWNVTAPAS